MSSLAEKGRKARGLVESEWARSTSWLSIKLISIFSFFEPRVQANMLQSAASGREYAEDRRPTSLKSVSTTASVKGENVAQTGLLA